MKLDFWTVLKYSKLMKMGLLAFLGGIGLSLWGALEPFPPRNELVKVAGVMTEGKQITKVSKRRRSGSETRTVVYELGLKQASGEIRKITVGERLVTRAQVELMFDQTVEAEVDADDGIYVLSVGKQALVTYEKTKADFESGHQAMTGIGAAVSTTLGIPLLLLGFFWKRWTLRKAIAAFVAQQQQQQQQPPPAAVT